MYGTICIILYNMHIFVEYLYVFYKMHIFVQTAYFLNGLPESDMFSVCWEN